MVQILQANNIQSATGQANGYYTLFNGNAKTQVNSAAELESLIIATRDNGENHSLTRYCSSFARKKSRYFRTIANGNEAVVVAIDAAPSANPLDITAGVREMLPDLEKNNPSSIDMNVFMTQRCD